MNVINLIGNLTSDVKHQVSTSGMHVASFRLAVQDMKDTDFINCKAFGKTAELIKNLRKGVKVGITGRLKTGSYEKNGAKVYTTDVVIDRLTFCEKKETTGYTNQYQEQTQSGGYGHNRTQSVATTVGNDYFDGTDTLSIDTNDLPF